MPLWISEQVCVASLGGGRSLWVLLCVRRGAVGLNGAVPRCVFAVRRGPRVVFSSVLPLRTDSDKHSTELSADMSGQTEASMHHKHRGVGRVSRVYWVPRAASFPWLYFESSPSAAAWLVPLEQAAGDALTLTSSVSNTVFSHYRTEHESGKASKTSSPGSDRRKGGFTFGKSSVEMTLVSVGVHCKHSI